MIVDTHCHLDFDRFDRDLDLVIRRAKEHDVRAFLLIGIDPQSWKRTAEQCRDHDGFWRAAGLHPNSVAETWGTSVQELLRDEAASGDLKAIGETGIDLYRSPHDLDVQREAFEFHLELARDRDLPVVIHQRAAEDEVLEMLKAYAPVQGVMHCFGGNWDYARRCLDLGLHLGVGGVATYRSAEPTRDAIKRTPLDRIVLETDAPFLAPQPVRGNRNEPAYLAFVVQTLAEVLGSTSDKIEAVTTQNAAQLFGIPI